MMDFFKIRSLELFAWAGFEPLLFYRWRNRNPGAILLISAS
jgi:hypothetical protein